MTVEPYDEPKISGGDVIIRRINPIQHVVPDDNRGCLRISKKAYSPSSADNGGMSVDLEALMRAADVDPRAFVISSVFTGSVWFDANSIRALELRIGYDPIPENPYHGEVWGNNRPNRFTQSQKRALASAAQWYVPIDGVELT